MNCLHCNTHFETNRKYQRYCSRECYLEAQRVRMRAQYDEGKNKKIPCSGCGNSYGTWAYTNDSTLCRVCRTNAGMVKQGVGSCDRCHLIMACTWLTLSKLAPLCFEPDEKNDPHFFAELDPLEQQFALALLEERL